MYVFLLAACALGYGWIGYHLNYSNQGLSTCVIKNVTGIPCPSCGSTRSIEALLHGQFVEALFINPAGYIILFVMMFIPIWILLDLLRKNDSMWRAYNALEKVLSKPWLALLLGFMVLANWFWNISKGL